MESKDDIVKIKNMLGNIVLNGNLQNSIPLISW